MSDMQDHQPGRSAYALAAVCLWQILQSGPGSGDNLASTQTGPGFGSVNGLVIDVAEPDQDNIIRGGGCDIDRPPTGLWFLAARRGVEPLLPG